MRRDVEPEARVRELIDETRSRMGDTIEELGQRLNPDRIQDEMRTRAKQELRGAKDAARTRVRTMMDGMEDQVNDAGQTIMSTIRDNPIPAAMVGVGLAWLMTNRRNSGDSQMSRGYTEREYLYDSPTSYPGAAPAPRYETAAPMPFVADEGMERSKAEEAKDAAREARDRVERKASETADRAQHAVDGARHRAQDAAHRVQDTARETAHRVEDRARHMAERAEHGVHRVEDGIRENPLAAGAVALALGFAAGMVAPETRREHRMMGPTRDRLLGEAERKARDAGEAVKHAAEDAAKQTAKNAMREMGGSSNGPSGAENPAASRR